MFVYNEYLLQAVIDPANPPNDAPAAVPTEVGCIAIFKLLVDRPQRHDFTVS